MLPNAAAQVVALWFGEGDFDRTLEIVCGIGHDVDCNAAQILCVLALQRGSRVVAKRWSAPLLTGPIVTYLRRPAEIPFDDLVALTQRAARRMVLAPQASIPPKCRDLRCKTCPASGLR